MQNILFFMQEQLYGFHDKALQQESFPLGVLLINMVNLLSRHVLSNLR